MAKTIPRLPAWAVSLLGLGLNAVYYGKSRRCPVCGASLRHFRTWGASRRKEALCVRCGALERHRFVWLFLQHRTNLFDGMPKRVLHVAPERCLERHLKRRLTSGYLTADLVRGRAMVTMDITDIQFPDETFDVIYCSHVLEHVADDRKAIREFYRVLKTGGWAVLLVPITVDKTVEDLTISDPAERLRRFGHREHVRRYGPDYVDRLREAGFHVTLTRVADLVAEPDVVRFGLPRTSGRIYYCTKVAPES